MTIDQAVSTAIRTIPKFVGASVLECGDAFRRSKLRSG